MYHFNVKHVQSQYMGLDPYIYRLRLIDGPYTFKSRIIQDDFSNIYLRLIYIVFAIYHFVYLITNQLDNKKIAIHTELETNPRYTDGV